jgi:hypothetical protein
MSTDGSRRDQQPRWATPERAMVDDPAFGTPRPAPLSRVRSALPPRRRSAAAVESEIRRRLGTLPAADDVQMLLVWLLDPHQTGEAATERARLAAERLADATCPVPTPGRVRAGDVAELWPALLTECAGCKDCRPFGPEAPTSGALQRRQAVAGGCADCRPTADPLPASEIEIAPARQGSDPRRADFQPPNHESEDRQ